MGDVFRHSRSAAAIGDRGHAPRTASRPSRCPDAGLDAPRVRRLALRERARHGPGARPPPRRRLRPDDRSRGGEPGCDPPARAPGHECRRGPTSVRGRMHAWTPRTPRTPRTPGRPGRPGTSPASGNWRFCRLPANGSTIAPGWGGRWEHPSAGLADGSRSGRSLRRRRLRHRRDRRDAGHHRAGGRGTWPAPRRHVHGAGLVRGRAHRVRACLRPDRQGPQDSGVQADAGAMT